jgi:hypothetical protein
MWCSASSIAFTMVNALKSFLLVPLSPFLYMTTRAGLRCHPLTLVAIPSKEIWWLISFSHHEETEFPPSSRVFSLLQHGVLQMRHEDASCRSARWGQLVQCLCAVFFTSCPRVLIARPLNTTWSVVIGIPKKKNAAKGISHYHWFKRKVI